MGVEFGELRMLRTRIGVEVGHRQRSAARTCQGRALPLPRED